MKSYRIGIDARLYSQTGVGRYIRSLLRNLAEIDKKNQYVLFVSPTDKELIASYGTNFRVRQVNFRWHTLAEQLFFPPILYKEKLDLVHFPYFSIPICYQRPFVVTIHDLTPLTHATGKASTLILPLYYLKREAYKLVLSTAINRARRIIVPSKSTKKELVKHFSGIADKIVITYEGVTRVKIGRAQRIIKEPYFLYVGNAYPHKNLDVLINAFLQLEGKVKLLLVGGDDFFYRRLKRKWQRNKNIIFFGHANDRQLANLYNHAIALVFPSLSEGFGLPAVEAMAYGCLVIASSIPTLKEICGQAALYFNPKDEQSLFAVLRDVYQDKNKYKKKITLGRKIANRFNWKIMAEKTLRVYQSSLQC